ncbi:hypothetical protein ANN_26645 [Periplaneta americana]|uniref:Uncharacterized protein n=1 Tax=Periplaneta americana TaxID=6978 RepID=A0ABQ8RZC5_PERAM|nr:hypothetical protein ANN_26645 [Periplaneta americana]
MNSQRVITYKKNLDKLEISETSTYFGDPVQVEVLKNKSCHQMMLNSTVLPKKSAVSKEKKNDVAALLKYFEITDDARDFYKDVLESNWGGGY